MMKKMAAILSVLMMVTILFSGIGDVFATEFSDVPITASYYKAVDRLPDRTREVFKRIVLDGKRHKEVAEEFEISVTTVKTLLARALAALRAELSEKTYSILLLLV